MSGDAAGAKVVAVVQARLGSVRFPRKVLELLDGRPAIQLLLERAAAASTVVPRSASFRMIQGKTCSRS